MAAEKSPKKTREKEGEVNYEISNSACQRGVCLSSGKCNWKDSKGFLVLIGVGKEDTEETADKYIRKMLGLRIFEDENGKTNLSLKDVGGQLLLVSQFTLYANCRKGNRPSFIEAGDPAAAEALYEYMIRQCKRKYRL